MLTGSAPIGLSATVRDGSSSTATERRAVHLERVDFVVDTSQTRRPTLDRVLSTVYDEPSIGVGSPSSPPRGRLLLKRVVERHLEDA